MNMKIDLKMINNYTEGISASVDLSEIKKNDYLLLPSLYVKKQEEKLDREILEEKIKKTSNEIITILEDLEKDKSKIVDLLLDIITK